MADHEQANRDKRFLHRFNMVIVIACLGLVISWFIPIYVVTYLKCRDCGAYANRYRVFAVPVFFKVHEGNLTKYWYRNVDTHHKHSWIPVASRMPGTISDHTGSDDRILNLDDKLKIVMLSSFSKPTARLAFNNKLWADYNSNNNKLMKRAKAAAIMLNEAYQENPKRNDWQLLLKKAGY